MPELYHPETGGEFDAPASAVGMYLAGGWVIKSEWAARQAGEDGQDGTPETPASSAVTPAKQSAGTTKPAATAGGSAEEI